MADVTKLEAKRHFNSGGTVAFIDYTAGKRVELSKAKVAAFFKIKASEVKFEDVMKYGPMRDTKEPAFRLVSE